MVVGISGKVITATKNKKNKNQNTQDYDNNKYSVESQEISKALQKCQDWFDVDRDAKSFITEEMEECYKLYANNHWDLLDPNGKPLRNNVQKKIRPNIVENVSFSLVEGIVAEFSEDIDIIDYPVEQGDDEAANIMTDIKEFIMYKNRVSQESEKFRRWYFLYGTGIWHVYWDPHWRGGKGPNRWVGDVRWKALHPSAVFPDARCRESIEEGRRIHKAFYVTQEYVKERWGKDVQADIIKDEMTIGDEITAQIPTDTGEEQVLLVETWYKGEPLITDGEEDGGESQGSGLHIVWWAGDDNPQYLDHANYVYYDPGENCSFPFIFRQRYPRENSVWGFGEMYYLKSPQIVMNKTAELVLEGHMHYSLGQTFYDPSGLTVAQLKRIEEYGTLANMWFPMKDTSKIKREHGKGVPESLLSEATRQQRVMEAIVGRFDISQGRTPSSVTAFRALDLLAERARVRLRSAEDGIKSAYEDCANYINNLVMRYYNERRAYRILGDDIGQLQQVLVNVVTGEEMPYQAGMMPPGQEWQIQNRRDKAPVYGIFEIDKLKKVYFRNTDTVMTLEEARLSGMIPNYGMEEFCISGIGGAEDIEGMEGIRAEEGRPVGEEVSTSLLAEGEDYEIYCPQFDTVCKVSTTMPSDRMFYMEVAKELFSGQLIDAETFWYVLSHGKFPPFEELMDKEQEKALQVQQQMLMQQQQMAAMQQGQLQEGQQQQGQQGQIDPLHAALESDPELTAQFNSLSPEEQQRALEEARAAMNSG